MHSLTSLKIVAELWCHQGTFGATYFLRVPIYLLWCCSRSPTSAYLLSCQIQLHPQTSAQIRQTFSRIIRLDVPEPDLVPFGLRVEHQVVFVDLEVEARDRVLGHWAEGKSRGQYQDDLHGKTCRVKLNLSNLQVGRIVPLTKARLLLLRETNVFF